MKKIKLLAIAPYEGLAIQIKEEVSKRNDMTADVFTGNLEEGVAIARRKMDGSYDTILSRGGTASLLAQNGFPVIDIPISIYDLLISMRQADGARKKYAIVGFESITRNAAFLHDVLIGARLDIYTIGKAEDAAPIMAKLKEEGIENVICDQISATTASLYHLNYILVSSGSESISSALDEAAAIGRLKAKEHALDRLMENIINASPDITVVFEGSRIIFGGNRMSELGRGFVFLMKSKLESIKEGAPSDIEFDENGLIYSAKASRFTISPNVYTVFYIKKTKSPFALEKSGIVLRNAEWARDQYMKSFYGCTNANSHEVEIVETYAKRHYPVFIYGERGTGKGNLAQLLYSLSSASKYPLYDIDMQLAGGKALSFIRHLYEDNPDKKAAFHLKNIDLVDEQTVKGIIDLNEELGLSSRAYIIATATRNADESLNASCMQYIERLQCLTIKTQNLRDHRSDIASIANLYIATLNRRNGTDIISIEDEGIRMLESYDWPGNNDQLARVLKHLNATCFHKLIKASSVEEALLMERNLNRENAETQTIRGLNLEGRTLKEIENDIVRIVLKEEGGNRTRTAKRLALSRATLWRMLQDE